VALAISLRHRKCEQLVGQYVAGAVVSRGDEALELEHLEHPEELPGRATQALRDRREIERRFFRREQFDDIETFLERGGAVAAAVRRTFVRRRPRRWFCGHEFLIDSRTGRRGILPQNPLILNFH
jgi:hypothetical protein